MLWSQLVTGLHYLDLTLFATLLLLPAELYFLLVTPFNVSLFSASEVPVLKPTDLMVEVRPRRVFSNGHTYHVNSISVNSDGETYLSADDLRINMWHLGITDRSFSILYYNDQYLTYKGSSLHLSSFYVRMIFLSPLVLFHSYTKSIFSLYAYS